MLILYFSLVCYFIYPVLSNEDQCFSGNDCDKVEASSTNLYSSFDNNIFKLISKAKKNYVGCEYTNCSCFSDVLNDDLKPFSNGIDRELVSKALGRGIKYQVINGRLFRGKECSFPARCAGVEHFINSILDQLPDMDLIINVRDWPQVSKHYTSPLPVFSFSKTKDYYDILYPAWSFWDGGPAIKLYPTGIGRWDKFRKVIVKEVNEWPWKRKKNKAFFRGSRTSEERDPLVLLSRNKPDVVDAAFTKNQAWKSDKDTLGQPPAEEIALEKHCHFKYLFNFRGVAASFRYKFLFLCKSLVFHVGDEWIEFYYSSLVPWIHYIPVKSGASQSELEKLVDFFVRNDKVSEEIAEAGHKLVWDLLTMENIKCYWKTLLLNYHKLLKYKPVLDIDVVDVTKSTR